MESYTRFPLGIETLDPFHFSIHVTTRTKRFLGGIKEVASNRQLDLEKYGVRNPVIARGLVGLLDLGILRNPEHLEALLESSSDKDSLEGKSLREIIYESFSPQTAYVTKDSVREKCIIASTFTSQLYLPFRFIDRHNNFIDLVDALATELPEDKAILFLDSFLDLYTNMRKIIFGRIQAGYKTGKSEPDTADDLIKELHEKFTTFDIIYHKVFQNDESGYHGESRKYLSIQKVINAEVEAGYSNLETVKECPFPHKGVRRKGKNGYHEIPTLIDITNHEQITARGDVDNSTSVLLKNSKYVRFYKMNGCVFFAFANQQTN